MVTFVRPTRNVRVMIPKCAREIHVSDPVARTLATRAIAVSRRALGPLRIASSSRNSGRSGRLVEHSSRLERPSNTADQLRGATQ